MPAPAPARADLEALKRQFRDGRRTEALQAAQALAAAEPADLGALRLCATMHIVLRDFAGAADALGRVLASAPDDADGLFNLALAQGELGRYPEAVRTLDRYTQLRPDDLEGWVALGETSQRANAPEEAFRAADRALALDPACVPAWSARASGQAALGRMQDALASATRALELAPRSPELHRRRGDLRESAGDLAGAAADFTAAVRLQPGDDASLQKATACLLQLGRPQEGMALCREVLRHRPDSLTARAGEDWLLAQQVPLWHVPMMNEDSRNRPYFDALAAVVTPERTVFEVGTGSGLLAMMAARLGARQVVTCEAVPLVADTAREIVRRNGLQDRVTVLACKSLDVHVGREMPERADILLHEVFSSELLGEGVLHSLEDAKARLLKPGGTILPATASLKVALVGGEALGKELHVAEAFGFDLSAFNAIRPRKRPIHREDLPRLLLSPDVEAFRFDFAAHDHFPPESKVIEVEANGTGTCWGLIQWIRFEFGHGIAFENHPAQPRALANWQQTVYLFREPLQLQPGTRVRLQAMHDRSRPWFELMT